ncbi:MAG TPA: hypothetical protein VNK96_10215 [Fimbriimonadales bacterium]|nr:hypothetical protein [Fimbriimonadales bacterium]
MHPKVSENSDKRPDFLIRLSNDFEFYLEAVLARGQSDKESKHQATLREVYDIINRNLESPEYLWEVTVLEHGHAPISGKQIVYEIGKFRKGISYSEVMEQCQKHGLNKTPIRYIFEQGGWRLEFIPIPKKEECIGKSNHRPLGVFSMPKVVRCKDDDDIRKAVNSKVKHHSIDGKPYIIAVNACNRSAQSEDFMDALYGSGVLNITTYSYGSHQLKFTRACDGVWLDKRGHPKNSNLIAVLGVRKLTPWTIESASLIAFENPYISYPPKARIAGLPRYEVADGMLNFVEGKTLGQLFKLPWEWP